MKHPKFWFVFWAYLISWTIWISSSNYRTEIFIRVGGWTLNIPLNAVLALLGGIGPGLAAAMIVALDDGWIGVRSLWRGVLNWRLKPRWLLFAWTFFPILDIIALYIYWKMGGLVASSDGPLRLIILITMNLPFSPLWEEVGWRGYLLPRLESKRNGLRASLILACIWGPWHLPLYWDQSLEWLLGFLIMVFALSIIFTWMYNLSRGTLLPLILTHGSVNVTSLYLIAPTLRAHGNGALKFVIGGTVCAALVLLVLAGPDLARKSCFESKMQTISPPIDQPGAS